MTAHDWLAEGRLSEAITTQQAAVAAEPNDPVARRLLAELLLFAGRFAEAHDQLAAIRSEAPDWPETERCFHRLLRSERLRSIARRKPRFRPEPPPRHLSRRWLAIKAGFEGRPDEAVAQADAADLAAPPLWGFLDGQEFEGLRDADDRFASALEVFLGGEYFWFAWETLRKVTLAPPTRLLDQLYRPATLTLRDGSILEVHLPLVYPASFRAGDEFALGRSVDFVCPDGGLTRCVGGKLLLVGEDDEAELPLAECRMIELR